mmetsp:Transcript_14142/g.21220  ORF Transcript_14142/g.21220 Transcript_14142/m.21220 type:complete len:357 (-) Transcript_14142:75-1145(-)
MDGKELSSEEVRKIANKTPNCREITKGKSNTLSFLLSTEPNPARMQIYCDTGTVVTMRIFDNTIRHIFKHKCSIKDVENIFQTPPVLSLLNLDELQHDDTTGTKESMSDNQMLEIGETILAAESEAIKSHYLSLRKHRGDQIPEKEYACSFPDQVMTEVEKILQASTGNSGRIACAATNGNSAVFVYQTGRWKATDKIPRGLLTKMLQHKSAPVYVSIGGKDRYYASFEDGKKVWDGPKSMDFFFLKKPVRCVAFGRATNDIVVVYEDGSWKHFGNIPNGLNTLLTENGRASNIDCITMGANGEYFVKDKEGQMWWGGVSEVIDEIFNDMEEKGRDLQFVDFGCMKDSYFMMYTAL